MRYLYRLFLTTFLTTLLFACSKEKGLTESQIRFAKAKQEQAISLRKASDILDTKLTGNLLNDLNHITYASEVALHAEQVFIDAKIVGVSTPEYIQLHDRLSKLENEAGQKAIELLQLSVSKTLTFRKDVDEMPLQPLSSQSNATSNGMVKYLAVQYKEDLQSCCIAPLKHIAIFLGQMDEVEHYTLRKTIANVERSLSSVLRAPDKAKLYLKEIDSIKTMYSANTVLTHK